MKIVVLNTNIFNSSKEVELIKKVFPETEIVEIKSVFDVLNAYNNADIVHIPTHSNVNLLFFEKDVISGTTIGKIFPSAKLIFFNSCLSKDIAVDSEAKETISWVTEVEDQYAIRFAEIFYFTLSRSGDIITSFNIACNQLRSDGYKDLLPVHNMKQKHQEPKEDNFVFNFNANVHQVIGKIER